jgi:hypothetical protein
MNRSCSYLWVVVLILFGKTNNSAVNLSAIADANTPTGGFVIHGEAWGDQISSLLVPVSVLAFLSPKWSMAYLELPPSFAKSMALVSV